MQKVESILEFAKRKAGEALEAGGWAVDATAGNGHDTCFLAEAVGSGGRVWAFDVQPAAIQSTRRRLEASGLAGPVTLVEQGHERMRKVLPPGAEGQVQAVMFNLGYLPGSDKTLITRPSTTLQALRAAASLLCAGGILTVTGYAGHPGGTEEVQAVHRWTEALSQEHYRALSYRFINQKNDPPQLVVVERLARDA